MPDFIRQGASVTATVLETAAGQLRKLSDADQQEEETVAETAATPAASETRGARPAAATRSRVSNPKAARKVRKRTGDRT